MTVHLSVADVRAALAEASGPNGAGKGEPSTALLGRLFHDTFADLVGVDPFRSGLRVIVEGSAETGRRNEQLVEHTWQRLLAPRLRRNAAVLQDSSAEVLTLWRATKNLAGWLSGIVAELVAHSPGLSAHWERVEPLLRAEVPLRCEIREPGWKESVRLVGYADSVLRVPGREAFCAVELKLGRAIPAVDLGQAALYYVMLARSSQAPVSDARRSGLAMVRFSPSLNEHVVEAAALGGAVEQLVQLIGRLAGVLPDARGTDAGRVAGTVAAWEPETAGRAGPDEPDPRHAQIGKRLASAYREHGVAVEIIGPPRVGPRFLRFEARLSAGTKLDGLRRRTAEVQHRLELTSEPLIVQEGGRLYVDVARPDPETVLFSAIASALPALDPVRGSAKAVIGVDPGRQIRFADLASAGRSHVLAAGTTGSGKSEWLRMMLASLIATNTPETLRVVTLDPKLAAFNDLEGSKFLWHKDSFWIPNGRPASELFEELIEEMESRYQLTRQAGSDDLAAYVEKTGRPLARIVCLCDEYFALISQNKQEKAAIERAVALLGAKARAAGIHLVLATQQPSRATVTGAIQANLPCRVALTLSSQIESTMILGVSGAERLTGAGDLLYKDFGEPVRLQAPYLPEGERRSLFRS
jgi:DNA segregation ATPase FtsK/SpoIIIE, S-DNA-T family